MEIQRDMLTAESVKRYLGAAAPRFTVSVEPSLPSTNTALKEAAESGIVAGTVMIAAAQTAGRGRRGRAFFSPDGTGLYISVLLKPQAAPTESVRLTIAAAVAAAEAIEEVTGRVCGIKWVNDLYIDGKKVAGILTESAVSPDGARLTYAIVGIGINLYTPAGGFPAEIAEIAGAISPTVIPDGRARIAASFLQRLSAYADTLADGAFMEAYRRRCFVLGRKVTVLRGAERYDAEAVSVTDGGELVVRLPAGTERALSSGEISVQV